MSTKSLAIAGIAAVGLLAGASTALLAQGRDMDRTPGQQMQGKGSPGASSHAPGHEKRGARDHDRDDMRFGDRREHGRYAHRHDHDRDRDHFDRDRHHDRDRDRDRDFRR